MSRYDSRPPSWLSGFVTGIGRVPGGPRVRARTSLAGDTEIQIATGSMVIAPKTEEQDLDLSPLPTFLQLDGVLQDQVEEGETTSNSNDERRSNVRNSGDVKFEANTDDLVDLSEDYQNHIARLIADHHTASRSGTSSSRRQEVYHGPLRDRTDSRLTTTPRDRYRSRSPMRAPASAGRRPRTDSPMFFPEARGLYDSGTGTMGTAADSLSIPGTPPLDPPSPGEGDEPLRQCRCPISFVCPHRRAYHLDCRPLVREWVSWKDRQDQEAFDM